jgi:hypothetical protein
VTDTPAGRAAGFVEIISAAGAGSGVPSRFAGRISGTRWTNSQSDIPDRQHQEPGDSLAINFAFSVSIGPESLPFTDKVQVDNRVHSEM